MANIQKIRQKIIDRAYYLSSHADFHVATLDAIDRHLLTAHPVKKQISVEVVDMAA